MDRNKELKVHRLRLPGRSLCSIRSNRKWCKRRGSSLQCQNCFFVYPIIDCNLKNLAKTLAKDISRTIMTADDYYDLKKYGYFPRDYSRKQFLIDLNDLNQEELPFKIYKGG